MLNIIKIKIKKKKDINQLIGIICGIKEYYL